MTTVETAELFDRTVAVADLTDVTPGLSADRRRTLRRLQLIELGKHPITHLPLHEQAPADASNRDRYPRPATCGTCVHRIVQRYHGRGYPKCDELAPAELALHTSRTDTYKWLPACVAYRAAE